MGNKNIMSAEGKRSTQIFKCQVNPCEWFFLGAFSNWRSCPRYRSDKELVLRSYTAKSTGTCKICQQPAESFRTPVLELEYSISSICQACQDYYCLNDKQCSSAWWFRCSTITLAANIFRAHACETPAAQGHRRQPLCLAPGIQPLAVLSPCRIYVSGDG